jgi:hypothetical protein
VLRAYSREWILQIQDVSEEVSRQRVHAASGSFRNLMVPFEAPYPVVDPDAAAAIGLSDSPGT